MATEVVGPRHTTIGLERIDQKQEGFWGVQCGGLRVLEGSVRGRDGGDLRGPEGSQECREAKGKREGGGRKERGRRGGGQEPRRGGGPGSEAACGAEQDGPRDPKSNTRNGIPGTKRY